MPTDLVIALRVSVALVFVIAASTKLRSREVFRYELIEDGVRPRFASYLVVGLPLLELALAVGLTVSADWLVPIAVSQLVLIAFAAYLLSRRSHTNRSCSCFGDWIRLTTGQAVIRNVVLLVTVIPAYAIGTATWNPLSAEYPVQLLIGAATLCAAALFLPSLGQIRQLAKSTGDA